MPLRSLDAIRDYRAFIFQPTENITTDDYRKKLIEDATTFVKGFAPDQGDIPAHMWYLAERERKQWLS